MSLHPAVFLDRDGTMIEDVGYLERLERLIFFPYTIDAVRLLNRGGFKVVVVTSQAGMAQGIVTEEFLEEAHGVMAQRVAEAGGRIDAFYFCPHHPDAAVAKYRTECECRKPKPGMILNASRDLSLDLARSFTVGDRWRDIQMGQTAGTRGVLVETGYGKTEALKRPAHIAEVPVVANLIDATSLILKGV